MKVGLVLGGGGARGLAHIGVIRALEEFDIQVVAISGCSIGAIIGAFYAAGKTAGEMQELVTYLPYRKLLHLGELGGLIGGKGIEAFLAAHLPPTFEELDLPLSMTAVDVQEGKLLVLRSGQLIPAIKASSALPGILSPVKYGGRYLVDGGVLNNLPVDIISSMTLAPVIAVDVAAPHNRRLGFESKETHMLDQVGEILQGKRNPLDSLLARGLTLELFMKAFDVPQRVVTEMRLSMHPPELLIRPELDSQLGIEDFRHAQVAIEQGYQAAKQALAGWLNRDVI
ncbi:MAG TPA: patatin-like phospholipase family protein [Caldilineaceae bacterium]|nr:patatin-like phospholipase family protein [Caldilineaceae bacterium]